MSESKENEMILKFDKVLSLLGNPIPVDKVPKYTIGELCKLLSRNYNMRIKVSSEGQVVEI